MTNKDTLEQYALKNQPEAVFPWIAPNAGFPSPVVHSCSPDRSAGEWPLAETSGMLLPPRTKLVLQNQINN